MLKISSIEVEGSVRSQFVPVNNFTACAPIILPGHAMAQSDNCQPVTTDAHSIRDLRRIKWH
jgi:hypothetical protein